MIPTKTSVLAAGLLALSAGAAAANPAVTQSDIHLRAGPGPGYGVVAVVPRGAPVEAWNCDGAWCKVDFNGRIGFSSQRYLDIGSTARREPVIAAPVVTRRVVTEPVVTESVVTEPVVTEEVVTGPAYVEPPQRGYVVPQYGQQLTDPITVTEPAYVRPAYRTYAYEAAPAYEPAPLATPVVTPLTPWRGW